MSEKVAKRIAKLLAGEPKSPKVYWNLDPSGKNRGERRLEAKKEAGDKRIVKALNVKNSYKQSRFLHRVAIKKRHEANRIRAEERLIKK